MLYRQLIRPRLGPPGELEPEAPPRFAQGVGLCFALAGAAGYATGLTWLGMAATAAALAAAFLNGVFGFCLGCEMYVLIRRIWPGSRVRGPGVPYLEELTRADTDVLVAAGVGRTGEAALIPRWWDARTARRTRTWSTGSNLAGRQAVPVA